MIWSADEGRCRTILDRVASGVMITDTSGSILWVNRAFSEITGYAPEDCEGKTPRILKSGRHTEEEYKQLWETIRTGGEFRGRLLNKKKDGSLYWEFLTVTPLRDEAGRLDGYCAILEDISALEKADGSPDSVDDPKELRAKERHLLKQLETLLAAERSVNQVRADLIELLSHEFRTPLAVIQSSAEIVKSYRTQMDDAAVNRRLERITEMVGAITRLLTEVLQIWQSGGAAQSAPEELDVGILVREVADSISATTGRRIDCTLNLESKPLMHQQSHHLHNALASILDNAVKFSPKETTVTVTTGWTGAGLEIEVRDEGAGFPPGDKESLFGLFARGSNTLGIPGAGLGLSIARRSLGKMGGWMDIASEPGRGTIVKMVIPEAG